MAKSTTLSYKDALLQIRDGEVCLAEPLEYAAETALPDSAVPDEQTAVAGLYRALSAVDTAGRDELLAPEQLGATIGKAHAFIRKFQEILKCQEMDIPLPAMFVTPADLLEHTENLERYDQLKVKRILADS